MEADRRLCGARQTLLAAPLFSADRQIGLCFSCANTFDCERGQEPEVDSEETMARTPPEASATHHQTAGRRAARITPTGLVVVATLCALAGPFQAAAFPSGAPESACKDLKPGHGVEAASGAAPFELTQDKLQVEAGDQIKGKYRQQSARLPLEWR